MRGIVVLLLMRNSDLVSWPGCHRVTNNFPPPPVCCLINTHGALSPKSGDLEGFGRNINFFPQAQTRARTGQRFLLIFEPFCFFPLRALIFL